MLADLLASPQPSDVTLLCTNVRTIDGKRPTGIDDPAGLFIIPLNTIRFIEAPPATVEGALAGLSGLRPRKVRNGAQPSLGGNGLGAEAQLVPESALIALPGSELHGVLPELDPQLDPQLEEDPSEELLRRIRDI